VPAQFAAAMDDDDAVDRVLFRLDGELIGTDYSAPFLAYVDPRYLGLTHAQFYAQHEIVASVIAPSGLMSMQSRAWMPLPRFCGAPAEFWFCCPYDGYVISTDGDTLPAGETSRSRPAPPSGNTGPSLASPMPSFRPAPPWTASNSGWMATRSIARPKP
jgi:hypothetical protein